ncbi:alanine dehydrogenase [Geoglobus acetivorans]|uniref:Alanine dehydrogenase n=1 Tax=Geoglobus acetivorans TaxID=565033 RepID=A0A0A7GEL3_GEOAI|nr:alanine dehydrogenase [Geoglobus acetivorans]
MDSLILSRSDVEELLTMEECLSAVEHAFYLHGTGKTQMPAKIYLTFENGDLRAMPAFIEGHAGIKWVNSHPGNREKGLPTVMAVLIYNDPDTGFPLAVMDATHLTNMRTGAAGGVAVRYLARKDSRTVGFVGCGMQARTQLEAIVNVADIERVKAYDISEGTAKDFLSFAEKFGLDGEVVEIADACRSDILVTTTPSRTPVVKAEWIEEGTHVNAIGADAPGKQELDPKILLRAKVVVDDYEQAFHSGEVNVPLSKGIITEDHIFGTLGEIVAGLKKGREDDSQITVFDSTGLAIQDIATASLIYDKAVKAGKGVKFRFF